MDSDPHSINYYSRLSSRTALFISCCIFNASQLIFATCWQVGQTWKYTYRIWKLSPSKTWGPKTALFLMIFITTAPQLTLAPRDCLWKEKQCRTTKVSIHSTKIGWTLAYKRLRLRKAYWPTVTVISGMFTRRSLNTCHSNFATCSVMDQNFYPETWRQKLPICECFTTTDKRKHLRMKCAIE